MADDSHGSPPIVPLAVDLHPLPIGNASSSTHETSSKTSTSDGDAPKDMTEEQEMRDTLQTAPVPQRASADSRRAHIARSSTDTTPSTRPPMLQKSATERPQHRGRQSLLGRNREAAHEKLHHVRKAATFTFDPYSSGSSSSDEDEHLAPKQVNGEAQGEPRAKRQPTSTGGPFSRFKIAHNDFSTKGQVSKRDGRLKLRINETVNSGYFAKTLGAGLKKHIKGPEDLGEAKPAAGKHDAEAEKILPEDDEMEDPARRVRLNIVVIVIGSRGDIQPFLKIGKVLKEDYGHRVRIATHPAFKKFVQDDSGLEFFTIGGDPSELMAFMVKNPGLIPSVDTIKEGEIGKRRAAMYDMFQGMWRACVDVTDEEDDLANLKMMGTREPFIADAIIANPPSFAPPHIAERLGIPLHMMFTFPYTPTVQFPHPLANIKASNVDANYVNFMSYPLVEMMTWQGLGDLVNRFRAKTLFLDEVSTLWAPGQLYRLKVPYTYMWSPGLVPKPKDWGPEIDISGFVFLDLASTFRPPDDLVKFLDDGEQPVYLGFGSIVVDDPDRFTELIFEAVKMAGVRALVSKGWGGFGEKKDVPDNIFMLENTPHDWLFPRVSAVVHHGGAGTTAIGLKCAKPTMIVPFFGDQPFWGAMVSKAKAGAHDCIPYKKLTAERLAEGIKQCLTDEARKNVQEIADSIAKEGDGAVNAVRSFHRSLPLRGESNMRCQILENRSAAWKLKNTSLRLCPLAAELLVEWKKIRWNELRLLRHYEWNDFGGPGEPVTGLWGAMVGTVEDVFTGVGLVPVNMAKSVKEREKYYKKRYKIKRRQKHNKETLAKANAGDADTNGTTNSTGVKRSNTAAQNGRPAGPERQETTLSKLSEPEEYLAEELAQEAGHGFKKAGTAILKSPMYFTVAIAQGFHNAPRLYGDETVRRPPRITGFHSGLRAGRDEFVHGIHDGVTGLWRQPIWGAQAGGAIGCLRGVGMGIGGLLLKDIAAFVGPAAYFMKGLNEEGQKKNQPTNFLRRARIGQGQKELGELGPRDPGQQSGSRTASGGEGAMRRQEVEMEVSRKWEVVQGQIAVEKTQHKTGIRAALRGKTQKKEGSRVPLKGEKIETATNGQLKKTASAPIKQAKQFNEEGSRPGIQSNNTAPDTAMAWKEKTKKQRKPAEVPHAEMEDMKEDSTRKQDGPNIFMDENGAPVKAGPRSLTNGVGKAEPQDDFESRQRATSDTTDWATIKALEGSKGRAISQGL